MQENLHGYESWCFASKKGTHSISGAYLLWWIFMIVYPQFRQNLASIAWSVWREHARTNEPNIKSLLSCIDPRNIRNGPTRIAIQYDIFRAWYCWLSYLLDVEVVHSPFQSNEEHDAVICRHLVVNRHWTFMDFWDVSVWINYVSDVCTCKIYLCINMYIYIYMNAYKSPLGLEHHDPCNPPWSGETKTAARWSRFFEGWDLVEADGLGVPPVRFSLHQYDLMCLDR